MKTSLKHELRTPLNHIIGYCEMLMEEAQDKSLDAFLPDLERIHAAGKRLLAVVNDLFDPAKADVYRSNQGRLDHEVRTPLNQIIGYTEMLQEEAQALGSDALTEDLGRIHSAARKLLALVLEHFTPREAGATVLPEIPAGATTFIRRAEARKQRSRTVAALSELTGRLLVVDDDEANRTMLGRRLQRLGHQVVLAVNGREALEKLRLEPFDLLLLDIQMPEMNGYEVLDRLKSDPLLHAVPVIVLSASSETDRVAHCIELGAEDYLPKPFDPVLLQARISACLEKKQLRDREVTHLRQIEEGKKRSDELLEIILPHDVAEELKATNAVKARRFENVGVLFCDIVGFTAWCNRHKPEEVLTSLQELVEAFERLVAEHGLEKIKTIGDCFMATAGLLSSLENPALNAVRCGLAMVRTARALSPRWQVRVGVHVGPVIAGVVGRRKYQYDVWGDSVNLAARMEEAAAVESVCVNSETWRRVERFCRGRPLGLIAVKGKGDLEIFCVEAVLGLPS